VLYIYSWFPRVLFALKRQPPPPQWARVSSFTKFLDHTQRRTTVGRTPLDEWSARRRDLYLTTLTTDKYPCIRWDSNPQSQQASGLRPLPYTARRLGPAVPSDSLDNFKTLIKKKVLNSFLNYWKERGDFHFINHTSVQCLGISNVFRMCSGLTLKERFVCILY